ncbi:helix-turn-helix domain-containing protein [Rossellomorea sp. KS-H15a]|uniref:helix-turn-helix domain-containing protein n=1 Tax=Rossellomorea sp. KS-H15a TaxID=2963940 RepID=UPI0020C6AB9C|nr:helix-turn-helix domain-containing protein [Rossellomorea sp. KS-H15a]UTE76671.1 helix-turn-helix domain-containing protein [Rossellomorea sp. KS-H15a]
MTRFDFFRPTIMPSPYTKYKEFQPAPFLRPYICCYWLASPYKMQVPRYSYDIIPDGCTDILFEYDRLSQTSSVTYYGMFDEYFHATEQHHPHKITFGIRFYPGSSAYFIREKAKDTARSMTDLNHLNQSLMGKLKDQLLQTNHVTEMIACCDVIFSEALKDSLSFRQDASLPAILSTIVSGCGTLTVEEIARKEVISTRTMNRLFEERIGLSPKKFSQIIRFQSILKEWVRHPNSTNLADGYFDQSHSIKDFKKRTGKSPSQLQVSDFYNTVFHHSDTIKM